MQQKDTFPFVKTFKQSPNLCNKKLSVHQTKVIATKFKTLKHKKLQISNPHTKNYMGSCRHYPKIESIQMSSPQKNVLSLWQNLLNVLLIKSFNFGLKLILNRRTPYLKFSLTLRIKLKVKKTIQLPPLMQKI